MIVAIGMMKSTNINHHRVMSGLNLQDAVYIKYDFCLCDVFLFMLYVFIICVFCLNGLLDAGVLFSFSMLTKYIIHF